MYMYLVNVTDGYDTCFAMELFSDYEKALAYRESFKHDDYYNDMNFTITRLEVDKKAQH